MVEVFGEERGSLQFRKVAPWYAKRFGPVKPFNSAVVRISSRDRIRARSCPTTSNGANNSPMILESFSWERYPVAPNGCFFHGGRRRLPDKTKKSNRCSQGPGGSLVTHLVRSIPIHLLSGEL